ncbi:MAG: VOC family protein [Alphaproteobacteria bacterium]|nr:VOC family protein [Alphaproteobacteria bacterium]MBV9371169.1 VOC family protein [Alphaproteobacteria bacterium]MBV9901186.1 VOC family protein [Alphaproteobacteria bacterium]
MAGTGIRSLVPLAYVADVEGSIAFYEKLGFLVANRVIAPGEEVPNWAWLRAGRAELMLARASAPVVAEQQAVLFYTYCEDVEATHAALAEAGLAPEPVARPFYNPGGEFRLVDPDGYVVYVAQI